jgi:hypothetical protein
MGFGRIRFDDPGESMEALGWLQWPAMVVTVIATWLVGSVTRRRRIYGFFVFLLSNVLWVVWGWSTEAYALIVLQAALVIMNIRGIRKNEPG